MKLIEATVNFEFIDDNYKQKMKPPIQSIP